MAALVGAHGESVVLHSRVETITQATRWLAAIELSMKSSVQTLLEFCVRARLEKTDSGW